MQLDRSNLNIWLSSKYPTQHKPGKRYLRNLLRNIIQYNYDNRGLPIQIYVKNTKILPRHLVSCPKTISITLSPICCMCLTTLIVFITDKSSTMSLFLKDSDVAFPCRAWLRETRKRKVVTFHDIPPGTVAQG